MSTELAPAAGIRIGHPMIVGVTAPVEDIPWRDLIDEDSEAMPYQGPAWARVACATGRFRNATRFYEMADGSRYLVPLLARAQLPDSLNIAASMPATWGIGGIVGSRPATPDIVAVIADDLRNAGFLSVRIRPNPMHASAWRGLRGWTSFPRRAHVLSLEGGFDAVWEKRFSSRARGAIRKAEKLVEVEFDTTGRLLPEFYALHQKSVLRWAQTQHEPKWMAKMRARYRDPYSRFEAMARIMGSECRVGLARIGGQPVASIVLLHGRNTNYIRGALDPDLIGNSHANELLHRHAVEHAIRAGHRYYHMGETGQSHLLARFKEKLGGVPYDYAEYRLEKLPLTGIDRAARSAVKALIGFRDVG